MKFIDLRTRRRYFALYSLRRSLRWIPSIDLNGIDHFKLMERMSDLVPDPVSWQKICEQNGHLVSAVYSPSGTSQGAFVAFFLEAIYFPIPEILRFPPFTTFHLLRVVGHEIGHHLVATKGYIFSPDEQYLSPIYEERMADAYAFERIRKLRNRWQYRMAGSIMNFFSRVFFEQGRRDWSRENFAGAAESWYKAWLLNLDNSEAAEWYWRAKARVKE